MTAMASSPPSDKDDLQTAIGRHLPPHKNTVRPAIFEYSCKGYLHLEDKVGTIDNGKSNVRRRHDFSGRSSSKQENENDFPLQSLPYCRGIQSRLRKVRDLSPSTRDASIMHFVDLASVEPPHRGQADENRASTEAGSKSKSKGASTSTAVVVGKRPPIGPAPALPVGPDAADYGPPPDDIDDDPPGSDLDRRKSGSVQILPPTNSTNTHNNEATPPSGGEEGSADSFYSTLSCWGMTTVSVLMLTKPDGTKEVAAVAPENTLGITVRDEGDAKGGDTTATLRVGPVEIAIGNKYEYDDDNTETEVDVATTKQEMIRNIENEAAVKQMKRRQQPKNSSENQDRRQGNDEGSSAPFSDRFVKTLSRTAESMADTAKTVTDAQFPVRVFESGERIAGEFGKTLQRTGKVAKDIFRLWSDDDDDENEGGR